MHQPLRVRLKVDLTRYHPKLQCGAEGYTVGAYGMWSRGSDRFTGVRFPEAGTFDILWESLEIIDEEYLREAAEREQQKWEALKHARDVVLTVGPRGGFRYLSYVYVDQDGATIHRSTGFRNEAEEILRFLQENGIPVEEVVGK